MLHVCCLSSFSPSLSHILAEADSTFVSSHPLTHTHTHTHTDTHTQTQTQTDTDTLEGTDAIEQPALVLLSESFQSETPTLQAGSINTQQPAHIHKQTNKQTSSHIHPRKNCLDFLLFTSALLDGHLSPEFLS